MISLNTLVFKWLYVLDLTFHLFSEKAKCFGLLHVKVNNGNMFHISVALCFRIKCYCSNILKTKTAIVQWVFAPNRPQYGNRHVILEEKWFTYAYRRKIFLS